MVLASGVVFATYVLLAHYLLIPAFGMGVAIGASVLLVGVQYLLGKHLPLRKANAREFPAEEYPVVAEAYRDLCAEMDLDDPDLRVGTMGTPNAFAVGRRGAGVVVVSELLLELLEPDEIATVLAHELAHIDNRDVVTMLLGQSVATVVGLTVFFVAELILDEVPLGFLISWVLSSVAQMLVLVFVFAISRYREYVADEQAAEHTDPRVLASALETIAAAGRHERAADVDDSVAALCIFEGKRGLLDVLLSTHPTPEKRIERLRSMA